MDGGTSLFFRTPAARKKNGLAKKRICVSLMPPMDKQAGKKRVLLATIEPLDLGEPSLKKAARGCTPRSVAVGVEGR